MGWVHYSGYPPAYQHEGYPVSVVLDGTEAGMSSGVATEVIGWRLACECGWRGMHFYPRSEWPSPTGMAPEGVDGWETGSATFAEWQHHLARTLPELAVHDLARKLAETENQIRDAVHTARRRRAVVTHRRCDQSCTTPRGTEEKVNLSRRPRGSATSRTQVVVEPVPPQPR